MISNLKVSGSISLEFAPIGGTLSGIDEEGCIEVLSLTDSFYF